MCVCGGGGGGGGQQEEDRIRSDLWLFVVMHEVLIQSDGVEQMNMKDVHYVLAFVKLRITFSILLYSICIMFVQRFLAAG